MSYEPMSPQKELELANVMHDVIERSASAMVLERLHIRLRDLGTNVHDEVLQFRCLQKACAESDKLAMDLARAGFGRIDEMDPFKITQEAGVVVQVFNRMIEEYWEATRKPAVRKLRYTEND